MRVQRFADRDSLTAALVARLKKTLEASSTSAVMLSGGQTPRPAYEQLGTQSLHPASGLRILYSDDRHVPASSDASNYRASLPLLNALALPSERVLRVQGELPLIEATAAYQRGLAQWFAGGTRISLGLGLLGLGADGHTASLFTPEDLRRAENQLAIGVQRPDGMSAVSVTPEVLSRAEKILVVVAGAEKRAALAAFLARDPNLVAWQAVSRCQSIEVWCDNAA